VKLVARGSALPAALLGETIAAIDRAVATWLEGNAGVAATTGAYGIIHLPLAALASTVPSATGCFACRATFGTARGGICQATARIKFLLTGGEHELLPTVAAGQRLILVQGKQPDFLADACIRYEYFAQGKWSDGLEHSGECQRRNSTSGPNHGTCSTCTRTDDTISYSLQIINRYSHNRYDSSPNRCFSRASYMRAAARATLSVSSMRKLQKDAESPRLSSGGWKHRRRSDTYPLLDKRCCYGVVCLHGLQT
jgi:hypothetical protein